ncbi:hypothetical protein DENSPDRAFT_855688, partial [Dentipellis sp. KUC8613]
MSDDSHSDAIKNSQGFDDSPTKRVKPMRNRSPTPSSESGSILARPPSTAESSSEDSGSADSHEKEWMPDVVPWTEEGAARHQRRRERHTQPAIRPIRHDVAAGRYLSGYWTVWSGAARNIDSLAAETWLSFDVVDFYLLHQWYAHSAGAQVRYVDAYSTNGWDLDAAHDHQIDDYHAPHLWARYFLDEEQDIPMVPVVYIVLKQDHYIAVVQDTSTASVHLLGSNVPHPSQEALREYWMEFRGDRTYRHICRLHGWEEGNLDHHGLAYRSNGRLSLPALRCGHRVRLEVFRELRAQLVDVWAEYQRLREDPPAEWIKWSVSSDEHEAQYGSMDFAREDIERLSAPGITMPLWMPHDNMFDKYFDGHTKDDLHLYEDPVYTFKDNPYATMVIKSLHTQWRDYGYRLLPRFAQQFYLSSPNWRVADGGRSKPEIHFLRPGLPMDYDFDKKYRQVLAPFPLERSETASNPRIGHRTDGMIMGAQQMLAYAGKDFTPRSHSCFVRGKRTIVEEEQHIIVNLERDAVQPEE